MGIGTKHASSDPSPSASRRRRGCLPTILIGLVVLLVIVGLMVAGAVWKVRRLRHEFTDTQPEPLPVTQPDPAGAKQLTHTFEDMEGALRTGRRQTFEFTDRQLNEMVASVPAVREARGRAHFTIVEDSLKVKASIPADQLPGFEGRFLNGEFTLDLSLQDDRLEIRVLEASVRGQALPRLIMDRLRKMNLADYAMQKPAFREHLQAIRSLHIDDGKLIIETGDH